MPFKNDANASKPSGPDHAHLVGRRERGEVGMSEPHIGRIRRLRHVGAVCTETQT